MKNHLYFLATAFLLLFVTQNLKAEEPNLKVLRKQMVIAIDNSKTTDSLFKSLTAIKQPTGIVNGFIGALQALKAKHAWNPYFKVKYLKNSEKTLKKAVADDPHNMEIRFMRFSIEHNVPGFMGFNKDLAADSEDIIIQLDKKNYGTADKELTIAIIKFLINSKRCTAAQNAVLNKHLVELT
ncbi:hypothetical protein SAMN05216464_106108 [Mucilaginibacter pineti]|uniref:Uncharacterized protein n=1 Tax=Mucilaginibacter pineti TaxID=1391627 RepID=A0A1G7CUN0_9SPHI|nr:hypothetical protein [Mucilaginibacter pineti]SDE43028.1 hypothetical protein SAMN05216464_106108 [Mucilaginibacter pineti]